MIRSLAIAAAVTGALALPARAEMARFDIDPEHAVVAFMVQHMGYADVLGRFTDIAGHFMFDPETRDLGAVEVTVGAGSLDTKDGPRDGHVKSGDFLDVAAFPAITFTADGGTPATEDSGTVTGTLTVRGVAQPLTLDVTLNQIGIYPFGHQKQTVGISARGSVLRSAFGMTYGVDAGLVGDEVRLIIEAEGIRAD